MHPWLSDFWSGDTNINLVTGFFRIFSEQMHWRTILGECFLFFLILNLVWGKFLRTRSWTILGNCFGQLSCLCWYSWGKGHCKPRGSVYGQNLCVFHGQSCGSLTNLRIFVAMIWPLRTFAATVFPATFDHFVFTIHYELKIMTELKQTWRLKRVFSSLLFIITYKEFFICHLHWCRHKLQQIF